MRLIFAIFLSLFVVVSPVSARDYYYFNKPGVDRDTYLEDRLACDELAGGAARADYGAALVNPALYNNNLTVGQNAVAAGLSGFLIALMGNRENRRLQWKIERICLADKGYRRFEVEKKLIREIEKIEDEGEQVDRYFELASRPDAIGEEMYE